MDFYTGNTSLYSDLILERVKKIILSDDKKIIKECVNPLKNILQDLPLPKSQNKSKLNKEDQLIVKLFQRFAEISYSFETLGLIYIYINSCPYKKIPQHQHLKYHIENYLQEIYLLKERYIAYLNIINKEYKNSKIEIELKDVNSLLRELIFEVFGGYLELRKSHVHYIRYNDNEIERLSTLELLCRSDDESLKNSVSNLYKNNYSNTKRKWREKIKRDLQDIEKLNEVYFGTLYKIITDENKKLIIP